MFITFEGPEGCGKSTHAKRLKSYLEGKGLRVLATFEPGEGVSESMARQVSDMLEAEFAKMGSFRLVERTKTDFITAEKKFSYAGLPRQEAAGQLARVLGAGAVVFGHW